MQEGERSQNAANLATLPHHGATRNQEFDNPAGNDPQPSRSGIAR